MSVGDMLCWSPQACLDIDPARRLTCTELLRLPYLSGVEATIPAAVLNAQVATSHADHVPLMTGQPCPPSIFHIPPMHWHWSCGQEPAESGRLCAGEGSGEQGHAGQAAQAEAQVCRHGARGCCKAGVPPHSIRACITGRGSQVCLEAHIRHHCAKSCLSIGSLPSVKRRWKTIGLLSSRLGFEPIVDELCTNLRLTSGLQVSHAFHKPAQARGCWAQQCAESAISAASTTAPVLP